MQPTDRPEFMALLIGVCEIKNRSLSEATLEIYWRALESYPIEAVRAAIDAHLSNPDTGQYFPTPADFLRHIGGGTTKDRAAIAWGKIERALRTVGGYSTVVFDDPPIMMALADMGGWPALCQTPTDDLPLRAKDFATLYAAYTLHPKTAYPRALPGLIEQGNGDLYAPPTPVLIGSEQRALAVWRGGIDIARLTAPVRNSPLLLEALAEEPPPALPVNAPPVWTPPVDEETSA